MKFPDYTPNIPVRYREEFKSRRIPYGEAEKILKKGDMVLYAADSYVYHTVELLHFYTATPGISSFRMARVRELKHNYEWSVNPDELFAFAKEQEVDRRKKANINTFFTRQLDETVEGSYFQQEVESFMRVYDSLTDAQAQLASQALKMMYLALSDEDQKVFAYVWEHEYLRPYLKLNGAELKPGFSPDEVTPKTKKI